MSPEIQALLRGTFLFNKTTDAEFLSIAKNLRGDLRSYQRGEVIYSPEAFEKKVGFVISGECEVLHRHESGTDVQLKSAKPGDTFGIIGAITDSDEYPTTVRAKKACAVYFLSGEDVERLMSEYPSVTRGIIEFFANRIKFLNSKIVTFSSVSIEQKMARYILAQSAAQSTLAINFNKARAAMEIGVGRASLYRILNELECKKIIKIENKTIQIIDLKGLERILK